MGMSGEKGVVSFDKGSAREGLDYSNEYYCIHVFSSLLKIDI